MKVVAIHKLNCASKVRLPLYTCPIQAGSPSFADDHVEDYIGINDLIAHPDRSFSLRVSGDSMTGANIYSGNLLFVDRVVEPMDGDIAIAAVNGELTVKRLSWGNDGLMLLAENPNYEPLIIGADTDFYVWGVVTDVLQRLRRGTRPLGNF